MPGTQVAVHPAVRISTDSLRRYGIEAFTRAGLAPEGAAEVTEVQLEANLRGQPTHNMGGVPGYCKRVAEGAAGSVPLLPSTHRALEEYRREAGLETELARA